jgi:hypothetical protein
MSSLTRDMRLSIGRLASCPNPARDKFGSWGACSKLKTLKWVTRLSASFDLDLSYRGIADGVCWLKRIFFTSRPLRGIAPGCPRTKSLADEPCSGISNAEK